MDTKLTVRRATVEDAPLIKALEDACFPHDAWSEGGVLSHLSSLCTYTLVAEEGSAPIGYLAATVIPPEGEILRVGVLPAMRGRGIGKKLLSDYFSSEMQTKVCFLEVREHNEAAIALYRGAGFAEVGRRKKYYTCPTEDALVMKWERRE